MNEKIISEIVFLLSEAVFDEGQIFIKRGDIGDRIHIIWSGEISSEVPFEGK
jgi:hypothetical protein